MSIERDSDQLLDENLRKLPTEIMPQRDLWPQLQGRLAPRTPVTEQKQPPRLLVVGQSWAAVFVLALVGMVGLRLTLLPDTVVQDTGSNAISSGVRLAQDYEQRKALEMASMQQVSEPFENWQQQLVVWDQAVSQVQMALDYYPEEPALLNQLETLYEQQIAYLQVVTTSDSMYY